MGGTQEKWRYGLDGLSKIVDCSIPDGISMEDCLDVILNRSNRLETPITLTPGKADFSDIAINMIYRQRLTPKRTHKILTYAGHLMQKYKIDFLNPNYEQFIRFMDYLEDVEKCSPFVLKWIWQITQKFLEAYGIEYGKGKTWNYKPPNEPPSKPRKIQMPDQMYEITHYDYSKDKVKTAFIQYTILPSCIFGWRNPSELCLIKTGDIDLDHNRIQLTEKKKHDRKRELITDYPQILNDRHTKSIRNWLDIWRPKIESQYSEDYLFISPTDGRPIREMQYTRYINYYVNPIFPDFKLYDTRHFCATGLFIRERLKTKHWDKYAVKRWLGHENDDTTDLYIQFAEQYIKICPYDWFKRLLKQPYKSSKVGKKALLNQITPITFGSFRTKTNSF